MPNRCRHWLVFYVLVLDNPIFTTLAKFHLVPSGVIPLVIKI